MTSDLRAYLAGQTGGRLRYGRHDCLIFVVGWVKRATGRDLLEGHSYSSRREGQEILARHGLADHVDVVARGLPEIPVLRARAGDVAVLDGADGHALGIVAPGGERIAAFTPEGLTLAPLTVARRMFRVS